MKIKVKVYATLFQLGWIIISSAIREHCRKMPKPCLTEAVSKGLLLGTTRSMGHQEEWSPSLRSVDIGSARFRQWLLWILTREVPVNG